MRNRIRVFGFLTTRSKRYTASNETLWHPAKNYENGSSQRSSLGAGPRVSSKWRSTYGRTTSPNLGLRTTSSTPGSTTCGGRVLSCGNVTWCKPQKPRRAANGALNLNWRHSSTQLGQVAFSRCVYQVIRRTEKYVRLLQSPCACVPLKANGGASPLRTSTDPVT